MVYKKGCFGEKLAGSVDIVLILKKGTSPSLLCHNKSTLSFTVTHDLLADNIFSLLAVEVQMSELRKTWEDMSYVGILQVVSWDDLVSTISSPIVTGKGMWRLNWTNQLIS